MIIGIPRHLILYKSYVDGRINYFKDGTYSAIYSAKIGRISCIINKVRFCYRSTAKYRYGSGIKSKRRR